MKFRSSFHVNISRTEQQHKQQPSTTTVPVHAENVGPAADENRSRGLHRPSTNTIEARFNSHERPASKKRILQNLFRGLRSKNTSEYSHGAQQDGRRPKTSGQAKAPKRSSSKPASQARLSFDVSDDVIERLMGPPKNPHLVKVKSDAFLLKHRQKLVIPERAVSTGPSPTAQSASPTQQVLSPVCRQELNAMFRGAPYFSVDETTFRPKVSFVEDGEELVMESNLDHQQSWAANSAAGTIAANGGGSIETPNILSANGLDAGSVGLEYFLQLPIADPPRSGDGDEKRTSEKRRILRTQPERFGLRVLDIRAITERLAALDVLYAAMKKWAPSRAKQTASAEHGWSRRKIEEMGEDLFATLIDGDLGISAVGTGSVTIATQIAALQRVLSQENLWHDFSNTESRLRLGQILFDGDQPLSPAEQPSERHLLLLQITLSAELFVRYRAAETFDLQRAVSNADLAELKSQMSPEVEWDMLLVEKFLDNLNISIPKQADLDGTPDCNGNSSNAARTFDDTIPLNPEPVLTAKSIEIQRAQLLDFAAAIRWPHLDDIKTHATEANKIEAVLPNGVGLAPPRLSIQRPISGMTIYHTPPTSPGLPMLSPTFSNNSEHSYFTTFTQTTDRHTQEPATAKLTPHVHQRIGIDPTQIQIEPWISQHWLSGLVLPGESASSLLMGTLLETSPPLFWTLGPMANLHSGFVYKNQGFWSKESVVGRVLAAGPEVVESMNWVSIPQNLLARVDDGWKNVEAKALSKGNHEPRLRRKGAIGKASDPLNGQPESFMQTADFTTPVDSPPVMGNEVRLQGLSFTRPAYGPATAQLTFSSPTNTKLAPMVVPLTHEVYFIASYPCQPPPPLPSPNSLTRTLTGSSRIAKSNAHINHGRPATSQGPVVSARPQSPVARPQSSGGPHGQSALKTQRSSRAISGRALTSRPSTFYETTGNSMPSDITKSQPPLPPTLNRQHSFDEHLRLDRTASKKPSALTLSSHSAHPSSHPLHIGYSYNIFPAATILTSPPESLDPRALSVDLGGAGYMLASRKSSMIEEDQDIMVLDCRGTPDLEVLARAWCSKIGEHAVIGKVGRTCLACCVREARGLGVGVVIRV